MVYLQEKLKMNTFHIEDYLNILCAATDKCSNFSNIILISYMKSL